MLQSSCGNFLQSGGIGSVLQTITRALAFPFFVIMTFRTFHKVYKRQHSRAFMEFGLVILATLIMADFSILVSLMSWGQAIGQAFLNWLTSL